MCVCVCERGRERGRERKKDRKRKHKHARKIVNGLAPFFTNVFNMHGYISSISLLVKPTLTDMFSPCPYSHHLFVRGNGRADLGSFP